MSREELNFKLNKIYNEIIGIRIDLDKMQDVQKRREAEEKKNQAEWTLRELDSADDNRWQYREELRKEFNPNWCEPRPEEKVEEI